MMAMITCSQCGTSHPAGARFCMACGAALTRAERVEERRLATIVFADLCGYTAASELLDPEAARSLSDRCLRRLAQEVVQFGGTVDKFIGDNVMAVFGVPVSHEDDPERAVRCALAMQDAMRELSEQGVMLSLRV